MILTLAWKELREHQGVWLTMAVMTVLAAWGLPFLVAMGDRNLGGHVAALTLLGLAAMFGKPSISKIPIRNPSPNSLGTRPISSASRSTPRAIAFSPHPGIARFGSGMSLSKR